MPVEPTKKSAGIEKLIRNFMGKDRAETIRAGKCMTCDGDATEFEDELSRQEYAISGMCEACQNRVFQEPKEEVESDED